MEPAKTKCVVTTRPIIPPYSDHPTLQTPHPNVTLRPFQVEDLAELHELRSQIEVMIWTSTGSVDADTDKTRSWMRRFMQIDDELQEATARDVTSKVERASAGPATFNFVVVYNEHPASTTTSMAAVATSTARVIGAAGVHSVDPVPECGYMIRKEYWGQGIATAVVNSFLAAYWSLERKTVAVASPDGAAALPLCDDSVDGHPVSVPEYIRAVIVMTNIGSRRVLEKCGFVFRSHQTVSEHGQDVVLGHYTLTRP